MEVAQPLPGAAEVIINHSRLQNPRDLPCNSSECLLVTFWVCEQGHLISFCVISLSDTVLEVSKEAAAELWQLGQFWSLSFP